MKDGCRGEEDYIKEYLIFILLPGRREGAKKNPVISDGTIYENFGF